MLVTKKITQNEENRYIVNIVLKVGDRETELLCQMSFSNGKEVLVWTKLEDGDIFGDFSQGNEAERASFEKKMIDRIVGKTYEELTF